MYFLRSTSNSKRGIFSEEFFFTKYHFFFHKTCIWYQKQFSPKIQTIMFKDRYNKSRNGIGHIKNKITCFQKHINL